MKCKAVILASTCLILLAGCSRLTHMPVESSNSSMLASSQEGRKVATKLITYSNLFDQPTQEAVKSKMVASLPEAAVLAFFEQVQFYNQHVPTDSFVQADFATSRSLIPDYDVAAISEKWTSQFPTFPGYNCRLTSFGLLKELVSVASTDDYDDHLLFIDNEAITQAPDPYQLTAEEEKAFRTIFGAVATENVTDHQVHIEKVQDYWNKKGVKFHTGKAKMVSVWMHDQLDEQQTKLFIGHVGVLIPTGKKYLFVEKISFEEPYQVLLFKSKQAIGDYLLDKYDVDTTGATKPFLMENDQAFSPQD
ncbi:DUF4300 family protein [Streptococcus sp. 20-1249]|uniref:DUF4300 family protein n=1 Tax=Streptococcus hepaticus TaxID=3349163 RepID=UPI00374A5D22